MKKEVITLLLFLFPIVFYNSCSEDDCDCLEGKTEEVVKMDSLSTVLIDLIKQKSKTGDIDHFIIPDYQDYAAIPQDPKNPITAEKVELGMMLYHDPATGTIPADPQNFQTYSCASCHPAECEYQPGIAQGIGEGGWGFGIFGEDRVRNPRVAIEDLDVQPQKTPSAMNFAFAENTLWDAKLGAGGFNEGTEELWVGFPQENNHLGFTGIETQAIVGFQVHRIGIDPEWVEKYNYKEMFDAAFPDIPVPERYTNLYASLSIAAYERTMVSYHAPFQEFLRGDYNCMTRSQKLGAILFFDKASCVSCHTGTAFANTDRMFAIGLNDLNETNAFRPAQQLGRGAFTKNPNDNYKFKVPQLYNLKGVEFYGHGSSIPSLRAMIEYCCKGIKENPAVPDYQLSAGFTDCNLTKTELDYLDDFVRNALYDPEIKRHKPDYVMSGMCFPNNDPQSIFDHGCN